MCLTDILADEGIRAQDELRKKYKEKVFFEVCDVCKEDMIKSKQNMGILQSLIK